MRLSRKAVFKYDEKNKGMQRGINPALAKMNAMQRDAVIINAAAKAHMILTLTVLRNQYGFGEKRMNDFLKRYHTQLEAYEKGLVSVDDLGQVLWDEVGIKVL